MMTPAADEDRRSELRAFLLQFRSRLTPADVGLPETGRRRVAGLRRGEVAELAGVSSDWYRWFESGRPINVSPPFLARLAQALRLTTLEQQTLYRLALPELYEAAIPRVLYRRLALLSPVQSLDEVDSVMKKVADAKDKFLSNSGNALSEVRPRIANSWRRSLMLGVNPRLQSVPPAAASQDALSARRRASKGLLDVATPTLSYLRMLLIDSGYAIVMTDGSGCILHLSAEPETLRALSRIDFEPGGDLSESACGTNAIGTAIADGRPVQLMGAENFCEGGCDLTCTGAPIRDPTTLDIVGALDVTANYRRIHPEILDVVVHAALEIEERLLASR